MPELKYIFTASFTQLQRMCFLQAKCENEGTILTLSYANVAADSGSALRKIFESLPDIILHVPLHLCHLTLRTTARGRLCVLC